MGNKARIKVKNKYKKQMTNLLKGQRKGLIAIVTGLFVAANLALPLINTVFAAAVFNQGSQPYDFLRVGSSTNQGGTYNWQNQSVNAELGDKVAAVLFFNNTGDDRANGAKVRIYPTISSDGRKVVIRGYIWANNAPQKAETVVVNLTGDGKITDVDHLATVQTTHWNPVHEVPLSGDPEDVLDSSGLSVGNIKPGERNAGFVVVSFRVNGDENPGPTGGAPEATTVSATNVDRNSATLHCDVDPNGANTEAWFEYGENSNNLNKETSVRIIGKNNDTFSFTRVATGLDEDTKYYFRCVAKNSEGTDRGNILNFTTDDDDPGPTEDAPEATTVSATDVDEDSATLRCDVDANGNDTEVWFEWGEDDDDLDEDTSKVDVDADETNERVEIDIDDLDEDTKYYFRCVAKNSEGTDRGNILNFTTDDNGGGSGDKPSATTLSADRIDEDSARLRCEVDTNGDDADVWFEWGEDTDLDEKTSKISVQDGETNEIVTKIISGLDEDTKYYFRCFIEDDGGEEDEGSTRSFTTDENGGSSSDEGPDVTTLAPTGVGQNEATLEGDVDANGNDTDVWFQWGTSVSNLNRETSRDDIGDNDNIDFDYRITGLASQTTYYYRAVARNSEGTDYGFVRSFRTGAPIVNVVTRIVEVFRTVEVEEEPEIEALIITLDADRIGAEDSREISYTVSYENRTDETFTDAQLLVDLPRELDFVDADPNADNDRNDVLTFNIGTISPDEQDSFVITTEVSNSVDVNDTIRFTADVEYTDSGTRKVVTVIDEHTFGELISGRVGGTFTALLLDSLRDFFTSPILWLFLLILLIYFAVRYFVAGRDKRSAALV
ncbi:MAG: hypothetical protein COT89_00615 [Candidatus Colwellbacteria bacterium CG10_big_fil_rev_8_21_14_0_10_42_22]|uniref:Ig-like domain-containing protein n=1 Tax=Candidatus Colwellbacteria bacterium CG10_big_fil_rev_8_21_14_0_10_42_22 TaxID=1974540 RepID=A0A2H0VGH4_9BACT|nr:MAG: hypothetical protein COT89_00615 [Candidatus Colwellbacteria bacterium CG10_big_fil_rev_8_21_14_0_10_42_22]